MTGPNTGAATGSETGAGGETGTGPNTGAGTGTGSETGAGGETGVGTNTNTGNGEDPTARTEIDPTADTGKRPKPLLQTRNLKAGYLSRPVVDRIDIHVDPGEVVCLLGPNGAGKTTTLLTVAGELPPVDGLVMFSNVPTWTPMHQRVRTGGIGLVTEERLVFTKLSARDNLRLGGGSVETALELFPELEPRLPVRGGLLSGGEQQMLALARALSRDPRLLLADELSLGLAPKIVDRLLGAVRTAADERGTGALIVEQHARKALRYADRMYLMTRGQIRLELPAAEAVERLDEIEDAYLSGASDTEDDHIERQRRKTKRKTWKRQRVRERELERLTGALASTRTPQEDDYYFDLERHRRDIGERLRGGRKMTTQGLGRRWGRGRAADTGNGNEQEAR